MTPNFISAKCAHRISKRTNDKIIIDNVMIEIRRAASIGLKHLEVRLTRATVKILQDAGYEVEGPWRWYNAQDRYTCIIKWHNA